jgi:hypothetical protein
LLLLVAAKGQEKGNVTPDRSLAAAYAGLAKYATVP